MDGDILEKLEDGFKNYLDSTAITGSISGSAPVTVYKGMDYVDKLAAISIVCCAENAEAIDYGMNLYNVNFQLVYRYSPDDGDVVDINTRNITWKLVNDIVFNNPNITTDIESKTNGLTIIDMEHVSTTNDIDGSAWRSTKNITAVCGLKNN